MRRTVLLLLYLVCSQSMNTYAGDDVYVNETIEVEGSEGRLKTDYSSPSVFVTEEQVQQYNAITIDDVLQYQPTLVVRRRYIGDPNATLGMRGSNMFQTTRSMVFADGLPLHYFLQSRFSGAPRWSLVATDELETAEVVYGPFNAEYSGNAMGGVVNIKTKLPQEETIHAEAGYFYQPFNYLSTDENLQGNRQFGSYGNKIGNLSFYTFVNRLENKGQPQTYRGETRTSIPSGQPIVSGAVNALDQRSREIIYFADSGVEDIQTNLFKMKLGYDFSDDIKGIFTIAYEDRERETTPNNYLRDAAGNVIWGDGSNRSVDASFNGQAFNVRSDRFGVSESNRETLLLGGHLEGKFNKQWRFDTTVSYFDILEDETISSELSPLDPNNTNRGRITEYDDTGWVTYDLKLVNEAFLGNKQLNFSTGYHYENYSLNIQQHNSNNFRSASRDSARSVTGGETTTHAIFSQIGWKFKPSWDAAFGLRYEDWTAEDGYSNTGTLDRTSDQPDRDDSALSPKFSMAYSPRNWTFRYSLAKAYRFAIVEELYKNVSSFNSTTIADSSLSPEEGLHHNFLIKYTTPNGFSSLNIFRDDIDDVIFNAESVADSVTTFLNIDRVVTNGIEFAMERRRIQNSAFDVSFNVTWMDAKIKAFRSNTALEGNDMPRLPEWRANLFTTYHVTDAWDLSLGARYQSDSFGRLDNTDTEEGVFGAQDKFLMFNFKTVYRPASFDGTVAFGIDNLTDDEAFVHHPYPQRTFFLEATVTY